MSIWQPQLTDSSVRGPSVASRRHIGLIELCLARCSVFRGTRARAEKYDEVDLPERLLEFLRVLQLFLYLKVKAKVHRSILHMAPRMLSIIRPRTWTITRPWMTSTRARRTQTPEYLHTRATAAMLRFHLRA